MTHNPLHGLVVVDKPPGMTSHTVVQRVKKVLQVRKAGHTGTLDPFATGVLPVCLNEGTKLVPFLQEEEKEYQGLLRLGIETDTQDITGKIIRDSQTVTITKTDIEETFNKFRGTIKQMPPMYSALKHKGVPLYRLARQGIEVERNERNVEIRELSILHIELPRVLFRVVCSKGTYIRTLASDIGQSLGCGACLEQLKRTRSGNFLLENSATLETLKNTSLEKIKANWIIPADQALPSLPAITINEEISRKLRQGKIITHGDLAGKASSLLNLKGTIKILNQQNELVAIAEILDHLGFDNESNWGTPAWRILRVFNIE